ncbi:MAG: hypothetical protein ACD_46C00140G0002 [uncultured bacterium]|nr:MAG: hypothetical protein ACD_46C00140G0002 [uncultured bacterium]
MSNTRKSSTADIFSCLNLCCDLDPHHAAEHDKEKAKEESLHGHHDVAAYYYEQNAAREHMLGHHEEEEHLKEHAEQERNSGCNMM